MRNKIEGSLREHYSGSKMDEQPRWNMGRGKIIRSAVVDEDGFAPEEDTPKHEGGKKRYGWERPGHSMNWALQSRWLRAQVGRKMNDIRSEVMAKFTRDNYSSRWMRKEVMSPEYCTPCKPMLFKSVDGWPVIRLMSLDETHVVSRWVNTKTVYVDADGFLRDIPKKLFSLMDEQTREFRKSVLGEVVWVEKRAFYKFQNVWFELTLSNPYLPYLYSTCRLCAKLKIPANPSTLYHLFGSSHLICEKMRTLSKKEIASLGLRKSE